MCCGAAVGCGDLYAFECAGVEWFVLVGGSYEDDGACVGEVAEFGVGVS